MQTVTDGAGVKYDTGKERFDLLPPDALLELVRVYTYGAEKYKPRNMERGMYWGRVFAALMRHLWKWWGGEEKDRESGLHHLAHAGWGCLTLLSYSLRKLHKFDDRSEVFIFSEEKTCIKDIEGTSSSRLDEWPKQRMNMLCERDFGERSETTQR